MSDYILDSMAIDFDDAISRKHLPGDVSTNSNRLDSAAFVKAVKVRLKCLGYLGKKNPIDHRVDSVFERAVKRFQKTVGMTEVDGWVGEKTWAMLEFLCSFENKQSPSAWLAEWCEYCDIDAEKIDFGKNEAVLRAVYLRLYVFGVFGFEDDALELNSTTDISIIENEDFSNALRTFLDFYAHLNSETSFLEKRIDLPVLKLIFEYDELIDQLATTESFSKIQKKHPGIVDGLARIELWLSGYDIAPGSPKYQRYKRKIGPPGKKKTKSFPKMPRALSEFYS